MKETEGAINSRRKTRLSSADFLRYDIDKNADAIGFNLEQPLPPREEDGFEQAALIREGQLGREHYHISFIKLAYWIDCWYLLPQNVHSYHNCGLIHDKTVDVSPNPSGKGVVLTTRKAKAPANQVAKAFTVQTLKAGSSRKNNAAISRAVGPYRKELETVRAMPLNCYKSGLGLSNVLSPFLSYIAR
jgi:hypothetical protein